MQILESDRVTLVTRDGHVILFSQFFVGRCRNFGAFFHSPKKLTERLSPLRSFKPPESLNKLMSSYAQLRVSNDNSVPARFRSSVKFDNRKLFLKDF